MAPLDQRRDGLWDEVSLGERLPSSRVSPGKVGLEVWVPHLLFPGTGTSTHSPGACFSFRASPGIPEHPLASYEDCGHWNQQAGGPAPWPGPACARALARQPLTSCSALTTAALVSFPQCCPSQRPRTFFSLMKHRIVFYFKKVYRRLFSWAF